MSGNVRVKSLCAESDHGWINAMTAFILQPAENQVELDKSLSYSRVKYSEALMTQAEMLSCLENLVRSGKLVIPGMPEVNERGSFSRMFLPQYLSSNDSTFALPWGFDFYQFDPTESSVPIPSGPYVSLDSPLYPGYSEILRDKFMLRGTYYTQYLGKILLILPNYSARIAEVKLGSKTMTLSVESKVAEKMILKVYMSDTTSLDKQEFELEGSQSIKVQLRFVPERLYVYLLSAVTGERIDFRDFHSTYPMPAEGITAEVGDEDIMQLIQKGESDRIEFKEEISKSKDRFTQSVVAFANTYGGTLFVGVDDDGNIVGTNDQKLDETVANVVRENCEPTIQLNAEWKLISEKKVYVVGIREGNDKPYVHKVKGVLVRRGSTNRIANRYELEEFFSKDEGSDPRWPWKSKVIAKGEGNKGVIF